MSLPVILSPAADREFEEATVWYEQNGRLGEKLSIGSKKRRNESNSFRNFML